MTVWIYLEGKIAIGNIALIFTIFCIVIFFYNIYTINRLNNKALEYLSRILITME